MDIYRRYGPALLRKCERLLASREEAEDVVQSVFIELIRSGRTDVTFGYLFRTATHRSLNRLRDLHRRKVLLERHGEAVLGSVVPPIEGRLIHLDLLVRLVDSLDEESAEILVLRYVDRMEQQEIADLVGRSRRTVGTRLGEIRARLEALCAEVIP